jgi:hypothetical protein
MPIDSTIEIRPYHSLLEIYEDAYRIGNAVNPVAVAGRIAAATIFLNRLGYDSSEVATHPAVIVMIDALRGITYREGYDDDVLAAYSAVRRELEFAGCPLY